jgi:hypothetical protein
MGFDYAGYDIKHYANHLPWVFNPFWDIYERSPYTYGAYVHNDIHFGHLFVDIGMRYDYLQPDTDTSLFYDQDTTLIYAEASRMLSPRLSIKADIAPFLSTWIYYGRFFQHTSFHHLYSGTDVKIVEDLMDHGGFVFGNIFIEPVETHVLEIGTAYRHASGINLTACLFHKRLYHLISTMYIPNLPDEYYRFSNINSGMVTGTELSISKPLSGLWTLGFDFIYQQVKVSDQWLTWYFDYYSYYYDFESQEIYADHDVNVTLNSHIDLLTPSYMQAKLLKDIAVSLFLHYQSGIPYPAMDLAGNLLADYNSERLPGYININLKIGKSINVGPVKLAVTAMIFNLLNTVQIVDVYNTTGLPDDHGVPDPSLGQFGFLPITSDRYSPQADFDHDGLITPVEFRDDYIAARDDYYDDPTNWKNPFRFLLGVGIEF